MTSSSSPSSSSSLPTQPLPQVDGPSRTQSFHGSGLAILRSHPGAKGTISSTFTHLYFSFPLKLITPRTSSRNATVAARQPPSTNTTSTTNGSSSPAADEARAVTALYIVGYGGGLVSGDCVDLGVDVGEKCTLLLLTQGSTKVFKMRRSASASPHTDSTLTTRQTMRFLIQPCSTLLVLPSPVTCYQSARYLQVQRFDLRCARTSSLVLLDWITPGREYLSRKDERWAFESYRSRNEVRVQGKVIIRDVLLLEQEQTAEQDAANGHGHSLSHSPNRPLSARTHPYSIYANLFLLGPTSQSLINSLQEEFTNIQQRVVRTVDPLIWSLSILNNDPTSKIAVVRVAGMETDQVRSWLRERLGALKRQVGADLYNQTMW